MTIHFLSYQFSRIRLGLYLPLLLVLSGCQGTDWGERLAQSVQPASGVKSLASPTPRPDPLASSPPRPSASPSSSAIDASPEPSSDPMMTPIASGGATAYQDLADVPAKSAIESLERLGVFSELTGSKFEPNRSLKRGEFARWLVLANRAVFAAEPSRQLRLAKGSDRPLFLDVPEDNPNFIYIQTLAQAGLISGDSNREFRPDSLLTRADLLRLKVPLDLPPGDLKGSADDLKQKWGFTDNAQIPANSISAIVADRGLGNASTILRTFGPIRALNPQDPVSRAEAAIALSVFGDKKAADAPLPKSTLGPVATPSPEPQITPTPALASPDPSPTPTPEASPSERIPTAAPGRFVTPGGSTP